MLWYTEKLFVEEIYFSYRRTYCYQSVCFVVSVSPAILWTKPSCTFTSTVHQFNSHSFYYFSFPFVAILFLVFQFQSFCGLQYYFSMLLWLLVLLEDSFLVLTTLTTLPQRNTICLTNTIITQTECFIFMTHCDYQKVKIE